MYQWMIWPLAVCFGFLTFRGERFSHAEHPASDHADAPSISARLKLPEDELRSGSGVYSMECGGKSFAARLWLIGKARRSISIQYYSFNRNITGILTCDHLVRAAERGVKIRLLVDEAASRMNGYEIKVLDAHKNIEIRVYNAGLKLGRPDKRLSKLVQNRSRLLRRMHNKVMLVDEEVVIAGGRNISDEYFDLDRKFNFRDRDVLLFGKAVTSANKSFNDFWESNLSIPVEELAGKSKHGFDPRSLFEKVKKEANDTVPYAPAIRKYVKDFPEEIAAARRGGEFLIIDAVTFVSDVPGKNDERAGREGGVCTDTMIALWRSAQRTVDLQTPYFITTDDEKRLLRETMARGVRVRILTNSLAAIDNPEAFDGYRRDRKEHLKSGLEIYEFRPDPSVRFDLTIPDMQEKYQYKAVFGLHSKTMVIDGVTTVIGSYNLDPVSADLNTECIAVIRSKKFSDHISGLINEEFRSKNAWRITPDYHPDKEAPLKKRIKSFTGKVYPKKVM
jgi:cardiolipin synthase C